MQTKTIKIADLRLSHRIKVGKGKFEKPRRITPSRRQTHVKVETANHSMVFDGYLGTVEVEDDPDN